jgi:hypothetical protein
MVSTSQIESTSLFGSQLGQFDHRPEVLLELLAGAV